MLESKLRIMPVDEQTIAKIISTIYLSTGSSRHWGDKTPYLINHIPHTKSLFPGVKIIFLVRDSRAVVNSLMKMGYSINSAIDRWVNAARLTLRHYHYVSSIVSKYEDLVSNEQVELERIWVRLF